MLEPRLRGAARRGKGISDSAAADVIASHAPLRNGSHKARQNGPKHYPQGIQGDRNPLGTPFSSIFRRAAKDGVPEGRRKSRAVGKKRTTKDRATGGRNEKIAPRKTAQSQFCHKTKNTNAGNSYVGAFPYGSASLRREVI